MKLYSDALTNDEMFSDAFPLCVDQLSQVASSKLITASTVLVSLSTTLFTRLTAP